MEMIVRAARLNERERCFELVRRQLDELTLMETQIEEFFADRGFLRFDNKETPISGVGSVELTSSDFSEIEWTVGEYYFYSTSTKGHRKGEMTRRKLSFVAGKIEELKVNQCCAGNFFFDKKLLSNIGNDVIIEDSEKIILSIHEDDRYIDGLYRDQSGDIRQVKKVTYFAGIAWKVKVKEVTVNQRLASFLNMVTGESRNYLLTRTTDNKVQFVMLHDKFCYLLKVGRTTEIIQCSSNQTVYVIDQLVKGNCASCQDYVVFPIYHGRQTVLY